jgi:hypothetical protein
VLAVELDDLDATIVTLTVELLATAPLLVLLQLHLNVIYDDVDPVRVKLNDPLAKLKNPLIK